MTSLNAACALIGDPTERAGYDRDRAVRDRDGAAARPMSRARAPAGLPDAARPPPPAGGHGIRLERGRALVHAAATEAARPEQVSRDWTTGRSSVGGGYDPSMRRPDGAGAAGPPPGNSVGERPDVRAVRGLVARRDRPEDLEYIEWLDRMPIGRPYRDEIDAILRQAPGGADPAGRGYRPARAVPPPLERAGVRRRRTRPRIGRAAQRRALTTPPGSGGC